MHERAGGAVTALAGALVALVLLLVPALGEATTAPAVLALLALALLALVGSAAPLLLVAPSGAATASTDEAWATLRTHLRHVRRHARRPRAPGVG